MLDAVKAAAKSAELALPYPRSFLGLLLTGFTLVMLPINNRIVDREVHRLSLKAEQVQRGLIVLVFLSTAGALTIALALTRYIARPISEIDGAIRQLGGADFSKPIAVRGPEDLRYLGRRLDWLRRRLEEFETQKNRFLRHVSHELKTPLTAIPEGGQLLPREVAGRPV